MAAAMTARDEGWIGRLSRLLGAREEDQHADAGGPGCQRSRSADSPDVALLDAAVSGNARSGRRARSGRPRHRLQCAGRGARAGAAPRRAGLDRAPHARAGRGDPRRQPDRQAAAHRVLRAAAVAALVGGVRRAGRAGRRRARPRRRRGHHRARSHADPPGRGDARRLRRQCQPRAAHAARRAHRLHRDAAGSGARRSGGARALPRHHAGAGLAHGAADRRSAVAVAHRAARASAARHAGRSGPDRQQVADGLQTLARDRDVAIEVAAPAEPLIVLGDRDELIRLFENLIENGLKYGASGKRVDIALSRAAGEGKRGARLGARLRARHRRRASAAADRALLPRRCRRKPRPGRHRARPRAGQAHPQPAPRPALHREQGRRRARPSQCACR